MIVIASVSHSDVTDRAEPMLRHPFGIGFYSSDPAEAAATLQHAIRTITTRIERHGDKPLDAADDTLWGYLLGTDDTGLGAIHFGEFLDVAPNIEFLDFAAALVLEDTAPEAALRDASAMLALIDGTNGAPLRLNALDDADAPGVNVEQAPGGTAIYRVVRAA